MDVFVAAMRLLSPGRVVDDKDGLLTSSVPLLRRGGFRCHDSDCSHRAVLLLHAKIPSYHRPTLTLRDKMTSDVPAKLFFVASPTLNPSLTVVYYHPGYIAERSRHDWSSSILTPSTTSVHDHALVFFPASCLSPKELLAAPQLRTLQKSNPSPGIETSVPVALWTESLIVQEDTKHRKAVPLLQSRCRCRCHPRSRTALNDVQIIDFTKVLGAHKFPCAGGRFLMRSDGEPLSSANQLYHVTDRHRQSMAKENLSIILQAPQAKRWRTLRRVLFQLSLSPLYKQANPLHSSRKSQCFDKTHAKPPTYIPPLTSSPTTREREG